MALRKNNAFTLVEVLIILAIVGILAAMIIPEFQDHSQKAKEATAKENLRVLRQQLELEIGQKAATLDMIENVPENPFNDLNTVRGYAGEMPAEATGEYGWLYHAPTNVVRLDWPGTDSEGVRYYDY